MEWTKEQRAVRALFLKRFVHGMGSEIARELGVVTDVVYSFKRGEKPFPNEKLRSLEQTLVRRRTPRQQAAEERVVRGLLVEGYVHGMGGEIARELLIAPAALYAFKRRGRSLSHDKLALMREFLLRERSDPQAPIRGLLVQCLSQQVVSASEVARRFRLHRSTISRFKDGALPFPSEQLDELAAYLRRLLGKSGGEPGVALPSARRLPRPAQTPRARAARRTTSRRASEALRSPMRAVLVELATRFAEALIDAVRLEPLGELPAPRSRERG